MKISTKGFMFTIVCLICLGCAPQYSSAPPAVRAALDAPKAENDIQYVAIGQQEIDFYTRKIRETINTREDAVDRLRSLMMGHEFNAIIAGKWFPCNVIEVTDFHILSQTTFGRIKHDYEKTKKEAVIKKTTESRHPPYVVDNFYRFAENDKNKAFEVAYLLDYLRRQVIQ